MRFLYTLGLLMFVLVPAVVQAAELSVFPSSVTLKTGESVQFLIRLESTHAINTVGTTLRLPPNTTFLSASDGEVLTQWIEHPAYTKTDNTVSFAGIVPNGWQGKGTLAVIRVAALTPGTYALAFNTDATEVYQNDGKATPEPLSFGVVHQSGRLVVYVMLCVLLGLLLILFFISRRYTVTFV